MPKEKKEKAPREYGKQGKVLLYVDILILDFDFPHFITHHCLMGANIRTIKLFIEKF